MISRLEWDTDFFGIETGKYILSSDQTFNSKFFNEFELVYIYSERQLSQEEIVNCSGGNMHLSDQKLVYHKKISSASEISDKIHVFDPHSIIPERLYDLAIQSGHYSRFSTDPNIPQSSFETLYKIWLDRSVRREIAEDVFVFETDHLIRGFITVGMKSNRPDIGLFAVNEEDRSFGIGKLLLQTAEYWAFNKAKGKEIQVVTQESNKGACRFYEKNGFCIDTVTYIYHWWKNKVK